MALSDIEIWAELGAGYLVIDPEPSADRVVASSVDLLLDSHLTILPPSDAPALKGVTIAPNDVDVMAFLDKHGAPHELSDQPFVIKPGQLIIGRTYERMKLPSHLAARVEGKSTLGRLGLAVHITAPTIHAGFQGHLALEMYNAGPFQLKLENCMKVCQLIFERLGIPSKGLYQGQFQQLN